MHGNAGRRRLRIERCSEPGAAGKQRCRVPVIAHAQHDDIERLRQRFDRTPRGIRALFGRRRIVLQCDELCGRRAVA